MYTNEPTILAFESGDRCITAKYGDNGDDTISVLNYAYTAQNKSSTLTGYAFAPDPSQPGKLKLHLDGVPFDGTYWILALGPVNDKEQYEWPIVSDSTSIFLFVLARDVTTFTDKYSKEVLTELVPRGFTGVRKSVPTYQGQDCVYESDYDVLIMYQHSSFSL